MSYEVSKSWSESYESWSKCYDYIGKEMKVLNEVSNWSGAKVLEIGCGTGRFTEKIINVASKIVSIDPDSESIKILKEKLESMDHKEKVEVYSSRLKDMSFNEKFDIVIFSWCIYELENLDSLTRIASSLLETNGIIIATQVIGGEYEETMARFYKDDTIEIYNRASKNFMKILTDMSYKVNVQLINSDFAFSSPQEAYDLSVFFLKNEEFDDVKQKLLYDLFCNYHKEDNIVRMTDVVKCIYAKKLII